MRWKKPLNEDFLYGVSTSAYQIEGSIDADGKSPSIWDIFCRLEGKIQNGDTGEAACDGYRRYKDDTELLDWLGVDAYRFSISWARIFPQKHKPSIAGINHYIDLIDSLESKGIKPCVTLYHWDLPIWAQEHGGWTNRKCADWFLEYALYVFEKLGNRVELWFTHNEPFCSGIFGHTLGIHAPGHKSVKEGFLAVHHILLSHGMAVKAFRKLNLKGKIGIVLSITPLYPNSHALADIKSAAFADAVSHRLFLEALFNGRYPEEVLSYINRITLGKLKLYPHDFEIISEPCDFLGVNYYTRGLVKSASNGIGYKAGEPRVPVTDMGWEVYPHALEEVINRLRGEYTKIPIYITENGAAYPDIITSEKKIHDFDRIDYLRRHLETINLINDSGGDIRGYFVWSLMDNFEWQEGYDKRFGLFYVDYMSMNRFPKESAYFYKRYIYENNRGRKSIYKSSTIDVPI